MIRAALVVLLLLASPSGDPPGWSRPVPLTTTSVDARPALVVEPDGRLHLFFVDRDGDRGVVRWIAVPPDERTGGMPTALGPADLRAPSVAAAGFGADIVVAWIAPSGEGMRAVAARLRGGHSGPPRPIAPEAADAGPVAVVASADGVHAVWSQTADTGRTIWHWAPSQDQGAAVAPGDAPGLSVGRASPSRRAAAGSPFAAQPAAGLWNGRAVFAWTDLRSGRSRTPEIYVAVVAGDQAAEERLTYSLASSTHPVLAAGPGTHLSAAWLELAVGGRYAITIATTARPQARRFVLGIPELDLSVPWSALAFAAAAAVGTLPYALFLTLAALFVTALTAVAGRAILDGTRAWRWLTATPARGTLASLGTAICIQRLAAAAVLPAVVEGSGAAAATVVIYLAAGLWVRRRAGLTPWQRMAVVLAAVFAVSALLFFPWSARTLSRLTA